VLTKERQGLITNNEKIFYSKKKKKRGGIKTKIIFSRQNVLVMLYSYDNPGSYVRNFLQPCLFATVSSMKLNGKNNIVLELFLYEGDICDQAFKSWLWNMS
jgi:hypothetical protein